MDNKKIQLFHTENPKNSQNILTLNFITSPTPPCIAASRAPKVRAGTFWRIWRCFVIQITLICSLPCPEKASFVRNCFQCYAGVLTPPRPLKNVMRNKVYGWHLIVFRSRSTWTFNSPSRVGTRNGAQFKGTRFVAEWSYLGALGHIQYIWR